MLNGAILLVVADTIGKIVLEPNGLPAGIIVAIVGAPYFLYLMQNQRIYNNELSFYNGREFFSY